jgi:hypothetical protein
MAEESEYYMEINERAILTDTWRDGQSETLDTRMRYR